MRAMLEKLMARVVQSYVRHNDAFKRELELKDARARTLALVITDPEGTDEPQKYFFYINAKDEKLRKVATIPQTPTTTMILNETTLLKCIGADLDVTEAYWAGIVEFQGETSLRDAHILIDWFRRFVAPDFIAKRVA